MDKSQEEFIEGVIAEALRKAGYKVARCFSTEESAPSGHGVEFSGKAGRWNLILEKA